MSTTRSRCASIIVIVVLLGVGAACKPPRETSATSRIVRVGVLQHGSAIPIIVAQERGFFRQRGIDVRLMPVTADQQMPSLLRGDVDIISPSSFPVIFSTYQQNPHKLQCFLVGGESKTGDTLYGIVVKKSSAYKSLADLSGKTIGSASKFTTVNLRNVLRFRFGDTAQRTTIREVGDKGLLIQGLQDGTLDAAVVDQPALSSRIVQEQFRIIERNFRAEYLYEPYWSGAGVANTAWISTHRDVYNAFLDGIDDALQLCSKDPSSAKTIFIHHFGLTDVSPAAIGMYVYPNARFVPSASFTTALMKMFVNNGFLPAEFDATDLFYRR